MPRPSPSGFRLVTNVEEVIVRRGRDIPLALSRSPVQRRADVLFRIPNLCKGHSNGSALLQLIEIPQNYRHDLLVFSVARVRDVQLRHGFEVGCGSSRTHNAPPNVLLTTPYPI